MKTLAIASVVGSAILFIYLAVAHVLLTFHYSDFKYTPDQDKLLQTLSEVNLEDGFYFLPYSPPEATMEERMYTMQKMMGKPMALINYHARMEDSPMTLIMSFIYNLIAVLILCIAMAAANDKLNNFGQRLWFVMLFVFFVIFSNIMLSYNWNGFPMHFISGQIIDIVVGYLLVGLWLAWYYGRLRVRKA
ncbi:MAG: hypothetical protein ABIQ74_09950 [Chitinophagales bacterium]